CMPSLTRRYVTTQKERIDNVCQGETTIIDCNARTATLLDVNEKVYSVVSLDASYEDVSGQIIADMVRLKMTSKVSIDGAAFGSQPAGDVLADKFTRSFAQSIASSGVISMQTRDRWTYYFLPSPLPKLVCIDVAAAWLSRYGAPQRYAPELQSYFDSRQNKMQKPSYFEENKHGPDLPSWRIELFAVGEHFQRQPGVGDEVNYFEIESGNMRAIRSDDSVFSVPANFTKSTQSPL
ncbi:MAG: hypothetical protein M3N13_08550, partial [Candidatus Eremiobacteraeota bacterium]|nr:hypothetical protein [Candidatus Eremiobacteraeota bacterium]